MEQGVQAPPERVLPGNPNALVFAADAASVFDRRVWRQLLDLASGPAQALHRVSGLTVAAGFGWRVALDRRNRRKLQITMYFVVDGPLAAGHVDALERAISHNAVEWSTGHVERVPANGILVWVVDGDGSHLLCVAGDHGPLARTLRLDGDTVVRVEVPVDEIELPDAPRVVGRLPRYDDDDREIERMRFAFAQAYARRIVEADGVVHDGERRFMDQVFSQELFARLDMDEVRVREYYDASLEHLPSRLGYHDKLALIGLFFSACCADGGLDAREMRVLKDAADALGLDRDRVVRYLQRFW